MKKILLEIGCDGGSITIYSKCVSGLFIYQLNSFETYKNSNPKKLTFISLQDAWLYLTITYPTWYQLYLIQITSQMTDLIKKDFINAKCKNEYTKDRWLEQLTGKGIGF
jgi:hypothetical protein